MTHSDEGGWQQLFLSKPDAKAPKPSPDAHALSISRFFNRDLSWLNFNDRVLSEAADPSVPPLERLRFATIVSSNLDEFFMVRVAEIARSARSFPAGRFRDSLPASQVLPQIREHVLRQKSRQATVLRDILEALRQSGIEILTEFGENPALDAEIRSRLPDVRYILRRSSEAIPSLPSERIHVFVRFPDEYAILSIREREARLIEVPSEGRPSRFVLAERWLVSKAKELFPGREVIEAFPFKIIRSADLRYRPDDEDSLEEQIVEAVGQRSKARVVRLEVDAASYSEGALFLATALRLDSAALYRFDLPLDLRTLAKVYQAEAPQGLRYEPVRPQTAPPLRHSSDLFKVLRRHDVILHHPYDSFDVVVAFLAEAARDPNVTRIYHTMYRTSRESPIMAALIDAVRRGKKVTAYVEIKARFDELNNVRWAEELRQAGVRVVRPMGGFKVHSKLTQILRREGAAEVSYLHLGTGNYHPTTARQYSDLGLLTSDVQLGREVAAYFKALSQRRRPYGLRDLLVAPANLQHRVRGLIREETRIQREGGEGRIIAKMNSLVDPDIIDALYEASGAGVKIDLLIRGICCLRPGIKGLSENIRVVSVVDRFLEHSRIYYFGAGGAEKLYLSSADWMPRNFYTRFEVAFPVKDPELKAYVRDVILAQGLADNVKSWALKPDGSYAHNAPAPEVLAVRSQFVFAELAGREYFGTPLYNRIPPPSTIPNDTPAAAKP